MVEAPILFNMDLANARTSARFCHEVASMDDVSMTDDLRAELENANDDDEFVGEMVDDATSALFEAGYYVTWDAGDVVVFDLRDLSDDDRETFYSEMENA